VDARKGGGLMTAPAYLTEKQVSELTQIPVRTLQDWRRRKKKPQPFRFEKFGRAVRYPASQFTEVAS